MGHGKREKPAKLASKLLQIREHLGLSQNGLVVHLDLVDKVTREEVSKFERGSREPTLLVILRYARSAGISTDDLIDDEIELKF